MHLSLGTVCYKYPSKNSSVPITVNCAFPENLCFKYDNTTASGEQVTIQGCISADQCRQIEDQHLHCCEGHLCNSSKYNVHKKGKKLSIYAHRAMFIRNKEKLQKKSHAQRRGRFEDFFCNFLQVNAPVLFSAQSHDFYASYNAIPF